MGYKSPRDVDILAAEAIPATAISGSRNVAGNHEPDSEGF